jgi:phosphohistidine phosphatase SixA
MKFINLLLIIFITLTSMIKADSNENMISELQEGSKIVFIRHAYAPGVGDPENFNIKDCSTQRNLDTNGKEQAKKIGNYFTKNKIPIYKIISSEWCRCKETALLGFKNFETKDFLNSFFSSKFQKNRNHQIRDLKEYVKKLETNKNLIFVTHYVVISEILDYAPSSGEIVISDRNFKKIDSIKINY